MSVYLVQIARNIWSRIHGKVVPVHFHEILKPFIDTFVIGLQEIRVLKQ